MKAYSNTNPEKLTTGSHPHGYNGGIRFAPAWEKSENFRCVIFCSAMQAVSFALSDIFDLMSLRPFVCVFGNPLPDPKHEPDQGPRDERNPFVHTEVPGNHGQEFHQNHADTDERPEGGNQALTRRRPHSVIGSAGGEPSRGGGD